MLEDVISVMIWYSTVNVPIITDYFPSLYSISAFFFLSPIMSTTDWQLEYEVASYPVHWTITRPTNSLFTGREEILSELEGIVRNDMKISSRQDPRRIVISGMGGQGKSEICLQLAHRIRQL